ncbi:MAG: threonine/serine exporter family protein [Clostridiales Family XIII bacterium]|jgi:uncharacterized membrane protein YjjP (DUF1212 family)|nr:threonine/serine exporter family protein [Clostridiales Family XIII bacterium]
MINRRQKSILILALFAGEIMMKSGAEIYRVEDTVTRICRACKIPYVECFATITGIFLSIDSGEQDGNMHTFIKRIRGIAIDLSKISKINEFSRVFTSTDLTIEAGFQLLREIEREKPYSLRLNLFGCLLIGASLCPCFGGGLRDSVFSAVITGLAYLASVCIGKLQLNSFIRVFLSCAACTLLSVVCLETGLTLTLSPVIIATITLFLPGVAITNAARDMLSGDMLSGTARMAEAFIAAIAIAGGVGIVLKIWSLARGALPTDAVIRYPMYLFFLFAFLTTLGFCVQFHVPKKHMVFTSLIGACGFCVYEYALLHQQGAILGSLLGSGVVAVLAEFASRAGKDATTLFIIPGIIPLVPGTGMYATMFYVLQNDFSNAAATGSKTFIIAGSIAVSLVIVASFARILVASSRKAGEALAALAAARAARIKKSGGAADGDPGDDGADSPPPDETNPPG